MTVNHLRGGRLLSGDKYLKSPPRPAWSTLGAWSSVSFSHLGLSDVVTNG